MIRGGSIRNHDPVRTLVFRLTAIAVAVLLSLSLLASWLAFHSFERVLYPELRLKAAGVAEVLARQINRALDYDIPLRELPGLAEVLEQGVEAHADIAYVAVENLQGQVLAAYGTRPKRLGVLGGGTSTGDYDILEPLIGHGRTQAHLRLSLDPDWLAKASFELVMEVASVILISVLVTFEVLLLVVNLSMARFRPQYPGEADRVSPAPPVNLVFVRLPVFLFCLSEELSRPFMPAYAQHLAPSAPWLPVNLAVSLPVYLLPCRRVRVLPPWWRWPLNWVRAPVMRVMRAGALPCWGCTACLPSPPNSSGCSRRALPTDRWSWTRSFRPPRLWKRRSARWPLTSTCSCASWDSAMPTTPRRPCATG